VEGRGDHSYERFIRECAATEGLHNPLPTGWSRSSRVQPKAEVVEVDFIKIDIGGYSRVRDRVQGEHEAKL
jgi:hypothetical protein